MFYSYKILSPQPSPLWRLSIDEKKRGTMFTEYLIRGIAKRH